MTLGQAVSLATIDLRKEVQFVHYFYIFLCLKLSRDNKLRGCREQELRYASNGFWSRPGRFYNYFSRSVFGFYIFSLSSYQLCIKIIVYNETSATVMISLYIKFWAFHN